MITDRSERRLYRRSPGRQYPDAYNPLKSQDSGGYSQHGRSETAVRSGSLTSPKDTGNLGSRRTTGLLPPRPDPRRTRQLLRKSIIASKSKSGPLVDTENLDPEIRVPGYARVREDRQMYEDEIDSTLYRNRHGSSVRPSRSAVANPGRPVPDIDDEGLAEEAEEEWIDEDELGYADPDLGYEYEEYEDDPLARRVGRVEAPRAPSAGRRVRDDYLPETSERDRRRSVPLDYDKDVYEEEERRPTRRKERKRGLSRRKLLLGAIAVGGTAVAAYELGPKIPKALEDAGTNIEHQLQDAFNKGFSAGAEAVRKELINGLDTLEGVSLEAAIGAAKLTRVAYDVFVSPLVTLAATIADDFLSALLGALIKARNWLAQINADNATLAALQNVLQSWVDQAHNMPKKLQTITETDLDGAQAYLRGLQRKIQEEQAKLNGQAPTPTKSTPKPNPTTTPKH